MKIDYARVSILDQNLNLQQDVLEAPEKVIIDQVSGMVTQRPSLKKAKEPLRKGDILVV